MEQNNASWRRLPLRSWRSMRLGRRPGWRGGGKRRSSGEQRKKRSNALPKRGQIQNISERKETACVWTVWHVPCVCACVLTLLSFSNFSSFSVLVLHFLTSHTSIVQHCHFSLYLHHCIPLSSLLIGHTVELRENLGWLLISCVRWQRNKHVATTWTSSKGS